MLFRTHFAFALFLGLLFFNYFKWNKYFIILIVLSSCIVDIDHPRSRIGKKFPLIAYPINFIFGHRKFFHSLFALIIASLIIWNFFGEWWKPFFLGYFSHILLDGFTVQGVNIIYPFGKLELKGFIEVGKFTEMILFIIFVIVDLILLYKLFFAPS